MSEISLLELLLLLSIELGKGFSFCHFFFRKFFFVFRIRAVARLSLCKACSISLVELAEVHSEIGERNEDQTKDDGSQREALFDLDIVE